MELGLAQSRAVLAARGVAASCKWGNAASETHFEIGWQGAPALPEPGRNITILYGCLR